MTFGYDIFNKEVIMPKRANIISGKNIVLLASSAADLNTALKEANISEYLIQSFQFNYGLPSAVINELGSETQYVSPQTAQGSITISKIVGFKPITDLLSTAIKDYNYPGGIIVIKPTQRFYDMKIYDEAGNETKRRIDYNLFFYGCKLESLSGGGDANSPVMQETVSLRFTAMSQVPLTAG